MTACHVCIAFVVMLQPLDVNNADKSKHKFMVQSMFPPPGEVKLEEIVRDNGQLCINI